MNPGTSTAFCPVRLDSLERSRTRTSIAVIERDDCAGPATVVKRICRFSLAG